MKNCGKVAGMLFMSILTMTTCSKNEEESMSKELSSNFEFVSTSELSNRLRIVKERTRGKISGTASDSQDTSDKIVVYAYEKGTFNAESETQGKGESMLLLPMPLLVLW